VIKDNCFVLVWCSNNRIDKKQIGGIMSILYGLGNKAVTKDEYINRKSSIEPLGARTRFLFQEIGIGKPLLVQIYTMYTGKHPSKFGFGAPRLLVSSTVKEAKSTISTKTPKAVNQLVDQIKDKQYLHIDPANIGTPYVYYSPAMVEQKLDLSISFDIKKFDDKLFEQVSSVLKTAGVLPVFAPASVYLFSASMVISFGTELGKIFVEDAGYMKGVLNIEFDGPFGAFQPNWYCICNANDENEFKGLDLFKDDKNHVFLGYSVDEKYDGDAPYVIVVVDGRRNDSLNGFQPLIASAEILEDFYGNAPGENVTQVITDAMSLYNDLRHNKAAMEIKGKIAKLDPQKDKEKIEELQKLFDGYNANIQETKLKVI
jgi:hypothetical protein